jgi:pilus assembly protein Flp/PilA
MLHIATFALSRFLLDESGQDMIEYALVAALIGLASVVGINGIASKIATAMSDVYTAFGSVISNALH